MENLFTATGDTMKFTILLESEDGSSTPVMIANIERKGPLNAVVSQSWPTQRADLYSLIQNPRYRIKYDHL